MTAEEWREAANSSALLESQQLDLLCSELADRDAKIAKLELLLALKEDHESEFLANHN